MLTFFCYTLTFDSVELFESLHLFTKAVESFLNAIIQRVQHNKE